MNTRKWIESLLDEMLESQWSEDIIKQEYERLAKSNNQDDSRLIEELEPINQYSDCELNDLEIQKSDFKRQLENFTKSDYQDYLITQAVNDLQEDGFFEEIQYSDEYLEEMIRQHLDEENDFLDMVVKEAIASDDYFQDYIENHFATMYECQDYPQDFIMDDGRDDFAYLEYPVEKEVFDDLGDTSYMDQGIFKGANTDSLEEPFEYTYYDNLFEEDLFDVDDDYSDDESDLIDITSMPDDLIIKEPADESLDDLIKERLFEERMLDKTFVEIIKRDKYWDDLINEKLSSDEKFNEKLRNPFH